MPSIVTHHLFAKDVLEKMPKEKQKVSLPHYFIFAQSFDNLFYYKFLTPWQGKEIRKFGHTCQTEKVNLYFEKIIDYITDNHLGENKELLAYLYGSYCHYKLDSYCHPFVIYYAGIPLVDKKYKGNHEKIEVGLDAYIYKKKTNRDLYKEKLADTLLPKTKWTEELQNALDEVYFKTFQKENIGKIYEQSVHTGNFLLRFGVTDKTGIKKKIYKIKDKILPGNRMYQYLSFYIPNINETLANTQHEKWHHPITNEISTKSFEDLYNDAAQDVCNMIENTEKYFEHKITKQELLKIIGNNSYTTGLPCDQNNIMKYFKH